MKTLRILPLIALFLGLQLSICAENEVLTHSINRGKLHKGGTLEIQITGETETRINVNIDYNLKKKAFYPIPRKVLSGSTSINLPKSFASEDGYLQLKEEGQLKFHKADVKFIKLVDYKGFYDCYEFQVIPTNGKWIGTFLYHPDAPSVGWVSADITVKDIPVIGSYRMTSQMAE